MARYINKDEFIAQIQDNFCTECNNYDGVKCKSCGIDDTIEMVENANEADVVPKSEVEELISENSSLAKTVNEASDLIRKLRSKLKKSKSEGAMEIFEEIENLSVDTVDDLGNDVRIISDIDFAELKKKYTEGL